MKKPHIELSLTGEGAQEALAWLGRKFRVHVLASGDDAEKVNVENTDFYREMEINRAGNLLEAARLKAGLSQKDLAAAVGIKQNMVSDYETGRRKISGAMARRMAETLKVKGERFK